MNAIQLGELFMVPIGDRGDMTKGSLTTTTAWGLVDFSDDVPAGVTALMIAVHFSNNDGRVRVSFAENDDETVTAQGVSNSGILHQYTPISSSGRDIDHVTVLAPGGKFYMAEYDGSTWEPQNSSGTITVLGYYMPVAQPQPLLPGGINVTWTKLTTNNANNWDCNIYYGKDGDTVYLSGQAQCANVNGAGGDSYPIATLPSGFRPPQNILVSANSGANSMIDPQLPIQARVWYTGNLYPGAVIPHSHCIYFNTSFICA